MGCSNNPATKGTNETSKKKGSGFHRGRTEEIKTLRKTILSPGEKLFLDYHENARKEEKVIFDNLTLEHDIYFELLNALSNNNVIEELTFSNICFGKCMDVFTQLYHSIKGKETLKDLTLEYLSNLGHKKGKAIFILSKELKLRRIIFKEIEFEEEDAEYIGMLLVKNNVHLEYFEIESIFFGEKLNYFLDGINENNSIKKLILNKLAITSSNFDFLISSLVTNTALIVLDVSNNPIKDGTEAFKKYRLQDLAVLKMNNCDIESDDLHSLCEGIQKNCKSIKAIELNHNNITNSASTVKGLQMLFVDNEQLEKITMYDNPIRRKDLEDYIKVPHYSKIACE